MTTRRTFITLTSHYWSRELQAVESRVGSVPASISGTGTRRVNAR
jgi:hypothetical protein